MEQAEAPVKVGQDRWASRSFIGGSVATSQRVVRQRCSDTDPPCVLVSRTMKSQQSGDRASSSAAYDAFRRRMHGQICRERRHHTHGSRGLQYIEDLRNEPNWHVDIAAVLPETDPVPVDGMTYAPKFKPFLGAPIRLTYSLVPVGVS
jgi:hypothetical protein